MELEAHKNKVDPELADAIDKLKKQQEAFSDLQKKFVTLETNSGDHQSQIDTLNTSNKDLTDKLEEFEKKKMDRRNSSLSSDDDYSSVGEMKDHLKHAR